VARADSLNFARPGQSNDLTSLRVQDS